MSITPQYSIVIPTYNRARFLLKTLDSVCNQTIPPEKYEILVINDGSTDDTEETISNLKSQILKPEIRYFKIENGGPAKARNKGIKESRGEIIFFTDDDCVVPPDWMATLLDGYKRHPEVVGAGGWYKYSNKSSKNKYFQKYIDFNINKNNEIFEVENKTNIFDFNWAGNTANMSYKKAVLEEIRGFDENLYFAGAVDWELKKNVQRRGYYLLYIPLIVNHLKIFNFINFFKKSFNQGRGRYYMFLKYPDLFLNYDVDFFKFFKRLIIYALNDTKFFFAYFTKTLGLFLGRCYAKHIKPFKNISNVDWLKKPNEKMFSVEKRNMKDNSVIVTKFFKFNKNAILNTETESDYGFFSIIIPTYNRSRDLINALKHLIAQTIPKDKYEILIIDDGSTDDTEETISNLKSQILKPEIRYFKIENGGPAKARNKGIKEAKGEIIFFTDDDCIVPSNWMETLLSGLKRYPGAVGAGGWYLPHENKTEKNVGFWQRHHPRYIISKILSGSFSGQYEILSNDPFRYFGVSAYNTANIAYKKTILEKVGGFKEDFYWPGAEDNDLAFRITLAGHILLYIPFYVIDYSARNFNGFIKLYFRRGANNYLLRTIHRRVLEKLRPGFVGEFGSLTSFQSRFLGPEQFLAFLEWLSLNAGIRYMKRALKRNPVFPKPIAEITNDREKRKSNYV